MNFYNGYSPQERSKKLRVSYRAYPNRTHPCYQGPCQICSDPASPVEPHTEDYAEPFIWVNPAEYAVCKRCHGRLHKRFNKPWAWVAYKAHIKRGGYGSDLAEAKTARHLKLHADALGRGDTPELPVLRPIAGTDLWWDKLTLDPTSLTSPAARPR